jgi:hypothetical protein
MISLDQLDHDDAFTVQAMTRWIVIVEHLDESTSSLESIDLSWRIGNRPRGIECRAQI